MDLSYKEAEVICWLLEDEINRKTPLGMDIHWICEMTRLYEKVEAQMVKQQEEPKKCVEAAAKGEKITAIECIDCADFLHGCEGFTKEICKYNEDLANEGYQG